MSEYFPKPKFSKGRVKIELDLSNDAIKADLKNAIGVNTSKFAITVYLAKLKSDVDKLYIDKLKRVSSSLSNLKSKVDNIFEVDKLVPVAVALKELSDVVTNNVVKKDVYNANIKDI